MLAKGLDGGLTTKAFSIYSDSFKDEREILLKSAIAKRNQLKKLNTSIYDLVYSEDAFLSDKELSYLLNDHLKGVSTEGMALRTRSKFIKSQICEALGYAVPKAFKKTVPRFRPQALDVFAQQSNNVQVWNNPLVDDHRYAIIKISDQHIIVGVRVIRGDELKKLDKTGTLTQKYQASLKPLESAPAVLSKKDSSIVAKLVAKDVAKKLKGSPTDLPKKSELLSLDELAVRLEKLIGHKFPDPGKNQERLRGAEVHKMVCEVLGYSKFGDTGQSPDILGQLLEIKLQTSKTIDLGADMPSSKDIVAKVGSAQIAYEDLRFLVFEAQSKSGVVTIKNFALVIGKDFFDHFPQLKGKTVNKKQQILLPENFFDKI